MEWAVTAVCAALLLWQADPYAEGLKALDAQQYEAAAELFTKAVEADGDDYGARFNLAFAYSVLKKHPEAIAEYERVLALKPGLYEAQVNLGVLLLDRKRVGEAVPHLAAAAETKPAEFRPRFYLAEALLESGDAAKAEEHYRAAAGIKADDPTVQLGLGRALARQKRLDEAGPAFEKAAALDPAFRDALLELAALYEQAGRGKDAIPLYAQFPGNVAAQEQLGRLMLAEGRAGDAIEVLERAVASDPTPANLLALAGAYRKDNQPAKALPLVERAVAAEPEAFDLRMMLAVLLRDQKRYPDAAREFFAAAKIRPAAAEPWSELAGMLILVEDYPPALAALDRVRALGAEKPGHLYFRAIVLDKTKQYKPALEAYQTFLAQAGGAHPDEEFIARQRVRIITKELNRR